MPVSYSTLANWTMTSSKSFIDVGYINLAVRRQYFSCGALLFLTFINPNLFVYRTTFPIDALDAGARFELAIFSS